MLILQVLDQEWDAATLILGVDFAFFFCLQQQDMQVDVSWKERYGVMLSFAD
jgi:hypothetical protein